MMRTQHRSLMLPAVMIVLVGCGELQRPVAPVASSTETPAAGMAATSPPGGKNLEQEPSPAAMGTPPAASSTDGSRQPSETGKVVEPDFATRLKRIAELTANLEFDAAQSQLEALETDSSRFTAAQIEELNQRKDEFAERQQAYEEQTRDKLLAAAVNSIQDGQLDEAAVSVDAVLAAAPTTEQSRQARELLDRIDTLRKVRNRLSTGMELLAESDRERAQKGQEILWEEQDVALPLLLQSLHSENVVLISNTLELLRKFNQPSRTLPAMIAILQREQQAAVWPVAIRELQKVSQPGGGPALLELILKSGSPDKSRPLLDALAVIVDPPPETFVKLLPLIYEDSPALAAALSATYHAVTVHHQQDVVTLRGLELSLTEIEERQLSTLDERLQSIIAAGEADPQRAAEAWAAERLAITMRLAAPGILSGVKVLRATAEMSEAPATGILDSVWNSVELKTMWRHSSKRLTTVVLDLGAERTVTGVRIWNCNEPNATHRGWKDVEIFVSSDSSLTLPVAAGVVPMAPGATNAPDFGATLPVPFIKGRYVKLQLLSVWRDDGVAGLSEVEILGY